MKTLEELTPHRRKRFLGLPPLCTEIVDLYPELSQCEIIGYHDDYLFNQNVINRDSV